MLLLLLQSCQHRETFSFQPAPDSLVMRDQLCQLPQLSQLLLMETGDLLGCIQASQVQYAGTDRLQSEMLR